MLLAMDAVHFSGSPSAGVVFPVYAIFLGDSADMTIVRQVRLEQTLAHNQMRSILLPTMAARAPYLCRKAIIYLGYFKGSSYIEKNGYFPAMGAMGLL